MKLDEITVKIELAKPGSSTLAYLKLTIPVLTEEEDVVQLNITHFRVMTDRYGKRRPYKVIPPSIQSARTKKYSPFVFFQNPAYWAKLEEFILDSYELELRKIMPPDAS